MGRGYSDSTGAPDIAVTVQARRLPVQETGLELGSPKRLSLSARRKPRAFLGAPGGRRSAYEWMRRSNGQGQEEWARTAEVSAVDKSTYVKYVNALETPLSPLVFVRRPRSSGDRVSASAARKAVSPGQQTVGQDEDRSLHQGAKGMAQAYRLRVESGGRRSPNTLCGKPQTGEA